MSRPTFNWTLPAAIEARLGSETYGSQRAIHEDDHLLLVLHEPPAAGGSEREPAVFLRRPDGKWLYHGMDNGGHGLGRLLDRYGKILDDLEKRHGKAETAQDLFLIIEEAIPMARAAGNMKEALQAGREMVRGDRLLIDSRDRAVEIARGMEMILADARLALDYRLARNTEEQVRAALAANQAQHKLNILAAWTLPLMTVATVFGMNLQSGLEAAPAFLFWAIFLAGLVLGIIAKGWVQQKEAPSQPNRPGRDKRLGR